MREIRDANAASAYFGKSDGGYYLDSSDLKREVGGNAAAMLGLSSVPDPEQFKRLLQGLHPATGEQLTAKLVDNRICGWDVTASIPKGVTIALERGDKRIHDALWEAGREAMADIEAYATTRERQGGKQDNRTTGNMMWFGYEHPETRPAKSDGMPDPDRHIHFVIPNLTYDAHEKQWKAIKFRPVMELRKFFDRSFDSRLASKLADLGYRIETSYKADERGKRYFSWDIGGMPKSVVAKFSRRTGEVEALAEKLGITGPGKDKLGATSRQFKRDDMTLANYRTYWDARVTSEEASGVAEVIKAAVLGENPPQENTAGKAVAYALEHTFERNSVVKWHDLAITAMERSMGGARPEEIEPEARRQGALIKDGEATTRGVLAEESRVIAFARDGKGTCRPMGAAGSIDSRVDYLRTNPASHELQSPYRPIERSPSLGGSQKHTATLSPEQQAVSTPDQNVTAREVSGPFEAQTAKARPIVPEREHSLSPEQATIARHVWTSPNRVILIRGGAGTGKTHTMKATIAGIDRPVVVLAPSADASRGVLRKEGFQRADTVSRFLLDKEFQHKAKNGVIWIDEAGLLGMRQMRQVFDTADKLNARVVLQGDKKQHGSIERGTTLRVLERFAGLPVAQLTDIRRQKGKYKEAVASLAKGDMLAGYDAIEDLGWVKATPDMAHNAPLVDEYMEAIDTKRADQDITDRVLAVAPTHAEAAEVTDAIRLRLQERGIVAKEEHEVHMLVPLHWTEAERGDVNRFDGTEVLRYHRNGGTFKAGDRVPVTAFKPSDRLGPASTYSVYGRSTIKLATGDRIRITASGKTADGKHQLDNGSQYQVKGFDDKGGIVLTNGWTLGAGFGHLSHGYVTTSHASQGKTVDRVLIAMGKESLPAISAEQFYVSVSRGREKATIFTDVPTQEMREAIQKADTRKSATELMQPQRRRGRVYAMLKRAREAFQALRTRNAADTPERNNQREHFNER